MFKILFNVFGPPAMKAIFGGIAAGATTIGATAAGACDLESIGSQVGATIGAAVIGYLVVWISPKNREKSLR